jgi:hypothetical protein
VAARIAVVIPTRNRPDLAERAIRSVLDPEPGASVVVSDNSTDAAARERLEAYCRSAAAGARYVRPPAPLPMSLHWEWALRAALEDPGITHVTYLPDRRAFLPTALRKLGAVAAAHGELAVSYQDDMVVDDRRPVAVARQPWSDALVSVRTSHLLRLVRRGQLSASLSRMLNTVAPRPLLDAMTARFGTVFDSVAPDFSFAFRTLAVAERTLYWDRSWVLQSGLDRSNGAAQIRGTPSPDSLDFDSQLSRGFADATPLPDVLTVSNAGFNEYFVTRAESEDPRFGPLMHHRYLGRLAEDAARLENPELREQVLAELRAAGWGPGARLRQSGERVRDLAAFCARRPAMLTALAPSLRHDAGGPDFPTPEAAWEWALANPRPPQRLTGELRTLLEDPATRILATTSPSA